VMSRISVRFSRQNLPTTTDKFLERVRLSVVDDPDSCWLWQGPDDGCGYGKIYIGNYKYMRAHRYAYELFNQPLLDGLCVLHKCDNRKCVNPKHLFVGTRGDNNTDRHKKGRDGSHVGVLNGRSKLEDIDVHQVRMMFDSGMTKAEIARNYDLTWQAIHQVITRRNWSHVSAV
jgi:hypothetical protein